LVLDTFTPEWIVIRFFIGRLWTISVTQIIPPIYMAVYIQKWRQYEYFPGVILQ